jgi:hypothetical protein
VPSVVAKPEIIQRSVYIPFNKNCLILEFQALEQTGLQGECGSGFLEKGMVEAANPNLYFASLTTAVARVEYRNFFEMEAFA